MKKIFLTLSIALAFFALMSCTKAGPGKGTEPAKGTSDSEYARNETVYTVGGIWDINCFNPLINYDVESGVTGLVYEVLFAWDQLTDKMNPWLAEKGEWTDDKTYTLSLRKGIEWTDGKPFTAKDVKFTFELAKKIKGIYYSDIWDWMESIEQKDDYTLVFKFTDARYQAWILALSQTYIIPEHIWASRDEKTVVEGANEKPVGTGCYKYDTHGQDRLVFIKNDKWWGITQLNMNPVPKRVVELMVASNNVALGLLMKGELDMSNNFLPGIPALVSGYGIKTWLPEAPYNVEDATTYMFLNTKRAPLDNVNVRKALASAINYKELINRAYENGVNKSNPFGFVSSCGAHMKYFDEKLAAKLSFNYDPAKAKNLLDNAGIVDKNKDGLREAADGSKISMSLNVPTGWSDWEAAARIIAENLKAVGLDVEAVPMDYNQWESNLWDGDFDMMLHNFNSTPQPSVTLLVRYLIDKPQPAGTQQTQGNYGRYDTAKIYPLYEQLVRVKPEDVETGKKLIGQIYSDFAAALPAIPIWNNGLWYQASEEVWTGWPTAADPYALPNSYPGMWERGMIKILCTIKPKPPVAAAP